MNGGLGPGVMSAAPTRWATASPMLRWAGSMHASLRPGRLAALNTHCCSPHPLLPFTGIHTLTARYPIHMTALTTLIAELPTWMLAELRVRNTCEQGRPQSRTGQRGLEHCPAGLQGAAAADGWSLLKSTSPARSMCSAPWCGVGAAALLTFMAVERGEM